MSKHKRSHRHFGILLAVVTTMVSQGIALADIQVQGSTVGSAFYQGSKNIGSSITFGVGSSLSYTAASFGAQSSNLALNLGSFGLSCPVCSKSFNGYTFDLDLTFQVPAGAGAETIQGTLSGNVTGIFGLGIDTVGVDFGGPTLFTYSGANGSGQFYVTVNDIAPGSIADFSTVGVTGAITGLSTQAGTGGSVVPEPGSIVLLGTILTALSLYMRKKVSAKTFLRRSRE